ncbi:hypothetical protein [Solwaraspora sp. WMMD792]|uniref:hypothetical protein n=1 Tax=Solwaraspora sp. WMMD792 TaxID=3016099 RepID=UPI002416E8C2|nr:hypothetical protein [Solwaraspora sp. WMMD792]MDG4769961.1 hypothetical protein [Solwaraspora sp. WMMD792]
MPSSGSHGIVIGASMPAARPWWRGVPASPVAPWWHRPAPAGLDLPAGPGLDLVREAHQQAEQALADLRTTIRGIHPRY